MNQIVIREERKEDYKQTELMTMRAFFNRHGPGCNEHYLVHLIRKSKDYLPEFSRIAEHNGKIVGAIFYTKAYIDDGEDRHDIVTFGPLCVEPTVMNQGVGKALLEETTELVKKAGYPGICIFGEPNYYPKRGFVTCDHFGITDSDGNNYDALMGYELYEGAFSNIHGKFAEPPVFEECNDLDKVAEYSKKFPPYRQLKLSKQWFHEDCIGRICNVQKNSYTIQYWEKELPGVLCGAFYKNDMEAPVVGDYVSFQLNRQGESRILSVCDRTSVLKRPDQSGHAIAYVKTMKEQVMVANFDYVFIVTSLNEDYNLNRIARYTAAAIQGNGIPVVILTKADLCDHVEKYVTEVKSLSEKVHVHAVCAVTQTGLEEIKQYLTPGVTIALIGSSGVGKSTLLNALAEKELMKTGEIRKDDGKGRHTTTYRQMFMLNNFVTIIDTPGMREFGMCDVKEGIKDAFSDVAELISQCRFHDCRHESEPGCAIKKALADGVLSRERWELYCALQTESQKNADMKAIAQKRRKHLK